MTNFNGTPNPPDATDLELDFTELDRRIARRIGATMTPANRTPDQTDRLRDILTTGLRWFYFPGGENPHTWSFLRKTQMVTFVAGTNWYALPADFIRIGSRITIPTAEIPLRMTTEPELRAMISNEAVGNEMPVYVAVRANTGASPTIYELGFYPAPDKAEEIEVWYVFDPGPVTASAPHIIGTSAHSETIIAACMAAAEHILDPELMAEGGGKEYQIFQSLLAGSISQDKMITEGVMP